MTPAALLARAHAAGLSLTLEPPDRLKLRGDPAALEQWAPILRDHKPSLVALLSGPTPLPPETREAIEEAVAERAAVREFDGGEPRAVAEREARSGMRVYDLLVGMGPGLDPRWVTLLAPGCDLVEARRIAEGKFGAERLLEIREHGAWK